MSDMIDGFKSMKDHKKRLREKYGVECILCKKHRPRASATILLPQGRCRIDGNIDQRPELTDKQWSEA